MKQILTFAILIFTLARLSSAQAPGSEQEVRTAIEKYRNALLHKDEAALKEIWADNYVFINGRGERLSKPERLANVNSGATAFNSIDLGESATIRMYSDSAAVVFNRVKLKSQHSGKDSTGEYQSLMVWVKGPSGWQLAANQLTPISGK